MAGRGVPGWHLSRTLTGTRSALPGVLGSPTGAGPNGEGFGSQRQAVRFVNAKHVA